MFPDYKKLRWKTKRTDFSTGCKFHSAVLPVASTTGPAPCLLSCPLNCYSYPFVVVWLDMPSVLASADSKKTMKQRVGFNIIPYSTILYFSPPSGVRGAACGILSLAFSAADVLTSVILVKWTRRNFIQPIRPPFSLCSLVFKWISILKHNAAPPASSRL